MECCAGSNTVLHFLQYPFLGPPSTRLAAALSSGSCQCQAAALQLSVDLQELEAIGLGEKQQDVFQMAPPALPFSHFNGCVFLLT